MASKPNESHPVLAKRATGQKKTFLDPNPAKARVVKRIFTWRPEERLGYQPIADRLNLELTTSSPATPNAPSWTVGPQTYFNVRDILLREFEGHHNRHHPPPSYGSAAPLRPVPQPVTDLGGTAHLDIRRHDRLG